LLGLQEYNKKKLKNKIKEKYRILNLLIAKITIKLVISHLKNKINQESPTGRYYRYST